MVCSSTRSGSLRGMHAFKIMSTAIPAVIAQQLPAPPLSLTDAFSPFCLRSLREKEVSQCVWDHPASASDCRSKGQGDIEHRGQDGGPRPDDMVP